MKKIHLKVKKEDGERIRKRLTEIDLIDENIKIKKDNSFIYFPLKRAVDIENEKTEVVEIECIKLKKHPKSLKESLKDKLSERELKILPKSFDIIGDIAILEIPKDLENKKEIIGNSLIETFKNIRVVLMKKSKIETEYRTRGFEIIAGENRTTTIHREYGCIYKMDIASTYFSPRLGSERFRIAEQVKKRERVLVMFAGIGPYAILIAKYKNPKEIYAIEMNPDAVRYMRENVLINKVNVNIIEGDVREETPKLGKFDRIVMPLPKDCGNFLDTALQSLRKKGIIHFYNFSHNENESIENVRSITENLGYKIEILNAIKCGSYSPGLYRICVDFRML